MAANNLSAIMYAANDLRLEQHPVPVPKPHQLLIRVHTVGICGSDVHYLTAGHLGPFVVKEPMILGHESSGVVVEVGSHVKGFTVGDRVAMEPQTVCMQCFQCKGGRYNLCPDVRFFATPPVHGSLTRFLAHDASFCFKLPDHVTMEEGALLEPLNVAVHTCRRADVSLGKSVLVCGSGPIGIMNLITAKAMGASQVLITDIDDKRLALAKEVGADHVLNVRGKTEKEVAIIIQQVMGCQPQVSLECTGVPQSTEIAIYATQPGGVVMLVGCSSDRSDLPILTASTKELDLRGLFRYANCYPTALDMVASGRINLKHLTRAHYTLEQSAEAFKRPPDRKSVV